VEISFGEWMMAFGFAEFVIASLLFEYALTPRPEPLQDPAERAKL
jgi:hypothetical protein